MARTKVYIAAPYSLGDIFINIRTVIEVADELLDEGYVPFVPHLTGFWHFHSPKHYDEWLDYDNEWLQVCDCLLRLDGNSSGADREVNEMTKLGRPVYDNIEELLANMSNNV
jgi:hypothetical protein